MSATGLRDARTHGTRTGHERRPASGGRNLNVIFDTRDGRCNAVKDLSFHLRPSEVLGIVGDSALARPRRHGVLGCSRTTVRASGSIRFKGRSS